MWALLCALLLQGHTSTVLRLLGPSHHHRAPAMPTGPAPDGTADAHPSLRQQVGDALRPLRAAAHALGLAGGLFVPTHHLGHQFGHDHGHHHAHDERHHHDRGDETVVALAGSAAAASGLDEGAGSAAAGSLTAPASLGQGLAWPGAASDRRHWPRPGPEGFQDFLGDLPVPPPRG